MWNLRDVSAHILSTLGPVMEQLPNLIPDADVRQVLMERIDPLLKMATEIQQQIEQRSKETQEAAREHWKLSGEFP